LLFGKVDPPLAIFWVNSVAVACSLSYLSAMGLGRDFCNPIFCSLKYLKALHVNCGFMGNNNFMSFFFFLHENTT